MGTASQYNHLDVLSSLLAGTRCLDTIFSPFTKSITGLHCPKTSSSTLRYVALTQPCRWLLRPSGVERSVELIDAKGRVM